LRTAECREQVGAPDVADEERVAGEHGVRCRVARLAHDHADRLRRVAGSLAEFEFDAAETESLAVAHSLDRKLGEPGRRRTVRNHRAGRRRQLEMAAQKVSVEVRLNHALDAQTVSLRGIQILRHVALRVDHHRAAARRVTHEVRRVRQAREIELLKNQRHADTINTAATISTINIPAAPANRRSPTRHQRTASTATRAIGKAPSDAIAAMSSA